MIEYQSKGAPPLVDMTGVVAYVIYRAGPIPGILSSEISTPAGLTRTDLAHMIMDTGMELHKDSDCKPPEKWRGKP